ncbi:MAG: 30S ribosomal protein S2 [Planctomycetota bacterium]
MTVQELLDAGAHFGHKTSRWNPKMARYIFGKHNKVHIIDLKATIRGLGEAYFFIRNVARNRGTILFVGTKFHARDSVKKYAQACTSPHVSERWLGGLLTNLDTIRKRVGYLLKLEGMEKDGSIQGYSKKMISHFAREKRKMLRNLDGVRDMRNLPAALIVVDPVYEKTAVYEARRLGIPVIGMVDTNSDPDMVDIVVPCNDDSVHVIELVLSKLSASILEGRQLTPDMPVKEAREEERPRRRGRGGRGGDRGGDRGGERGGAEMPMAVSVGGEGDSGGGRGRGRRRRKNADAEPASTTSE